MQQHWRSANVLSNSRFAMEDTRQRAHSNQRDNLRLNFLDWDKYYKRQPEQLLREQIRIPIHKNTSQEWNISGSYSDNEKDNLNWLWNR